MSDRRDKNDHAFAVNPEVCPECAEEKRVRLQAGVCPECGFEAD